MDKLNTAKILIDTVVSVINQTYNSPNYEINADTLLACRNALERAHELIMEYQIESSKNNDKR